MNPISFEDASIVWRAAVETEFSVACEWIPWADRMIAESDELPLWIIDLSVARSRQDALAAIYSCTCTLNQQVWDRINPTELKFGFMFLRFQRGDTTLSSLLMDAGELSDRVNYRMDCSIFYKLAMEAEMQATISSSEDLFERVSGIFAPFADRAITLWSMLSDGNSIVLKSS